MMENVVVMELAPPAHLVRGAWTAVSPPLRSAACYAVLPGSTVAYHGGMAQPEINQRDLRSRSKEIMDAVAGGQSFTVTRDGHEIGELIPLRRRRRFVARDEFTAMSRNAVSVDITAFRADQDAAVDSEAVDPHER